MPAVGDAAAERPTRSMPVVGALRAVADRRADEAPERVAAEPDRDERQQELAERLMRNGAERAALVRQLAAVPERELERQDADDPVDQAARDEACT